MQDIDSLMINNKGLIYKQLHRFNLIDDPEAESLAFEALYKAIITFDPSANTKLSTYATVIIYNTLGSYIRSLNIKSQLPVVSYNSTAFTDDNGDHEFAELIASDVDLESSYVNKELGALAMQAFDKAFARLTNDNHKKILKAWKESDFEAQTKGIALEVGVSQSYVSQVINNFKHRLRKELEDVYYD